MSNTYKNNSVKQYKKSSVNQKTTHSDQRNKMLEKNVKYSNKNKYKGVEEKQDFNFAIIPLIVIITVLPLIMKMTYYDPKLIQYSWFPNSTKQIDFFLYYKHLWFVIITALMAITITCSKIIRKKPLKFSTIFLPLAGYAILTLLSAIFSKNAYHSFHGSIDQFESVFALLGYCLTVYYSFQFIRSEYDIKRLVNALFIGVLVFSFIGITQFLGHDFFATRIGTRLITSADFVRNQQVLNFNFEGDRVYLTLFNPNYVGVYVALVAPVFLILILFSKRLWNSLLYILALIGLIICGIGSKSIAGVVGITVAVLGILVFMWRYLVKKYYITIPVFLILLVALFVINKQSNNVMFNRFENAFHIQKTSKDLEGIITGDDKVTIKYKGNQLNIALNLVDDSTLQFDITDQNNEEVEYTFVDDTGLNVITDERFEGIKFTQLSDMDYRSFLVKMVKQDWIFTNNYGDGSYYFYNRYQKWDKIYTPPRTFLSDYGTIASRRGYIWDRTLPLIKDNIILGSGPDTFTMNFPQRDYVGFINYYYYSQLITKPHNMYLQIAVQTGLLSLILFLAFYIMYFVSSFRLYIKGRFNSYYAQIGVAIFIGSIAYMVTGLTNDSSITTAPVFWALMGMGIAVNHKVKPLILEEVNIYKTKKLELKSSEKKVEVDDVN